MDQAAYEAKQREIAAKAEAVAKEAREDRMRRAREQVALQRREAAEREAAAKAGAVAKEAAAEAAHRAAAREQEAWDEALRLAELEAWLN